MFVLLPLDAGTPLWLVLVLLVPTGLGGAFAVPALTAQLMDSVPGERAGTASGLLNSLRQTGGAMSVALFGALLAGGGGEGGGEGAAGFSLAGMHTGLVVVGVTLCVTTVLAAWLLPRTETASKLDLKASSEGSSTAAPKLAPEPASELASATSS